MAPPPPPDQSEGQINAKVATNRPKAAVVVYEDKNKLDRPKDMLNRYWLATDCLCDTWHLDLCSLFLVSFLYDEYNMYYCNFAVSGGACSDVVLPVVRVLEVEMLMLVLISFNDGHDDNAREARWRWWWFTNCGW